MMFKIMLIIQFLASVYQIQAQLLANSSNTQILITSEVNILPYINSSDTYDVNDTISIIKFTPKHVYALSTSGIIQIFNKNNPSLLQANINDCFMFSNQSALFEINGMVFDVNYSTFVLSTLYNSTLRHVIFTIENESFPLYLSIVDIQTFYVEPYMVTFIANNILYSFFSATGQNDELLCLCLDSNLTYTISLPTVNSSLAVSPDGRFGLVWTQYSLLYIFDISNNFTLLHTYNISVFNQKGTTQFIKFSKDSTMAILQTDNRYPIRVISLINFTTLFNITINKKIKSVDFLDIHNRFILINCVAFTYVYDTITATFLTFNASLSASSILVDHNNSQIIAEINGTHTVFGINATVDGVLLFGHYFPRNSNQTISNQFSYRLNLTLQQNQTLEAINSVSNVIEQTLIKFNSIIFSSPLTCFFLGLFNYFVLNSLYVLLNIPLPEIVFSELSSIFNSTNTNLLSSLGIKVAVSPITDELVDEDKPLYFGISSDLISANYYPVALIIVNVILVQVIISLNRCVPKQSIFSIFFSLKRQQVYFGFIVSMFVGNILPWKFITFHDSYNFKTKNNSFWFHIIFIFFFQFLAITFISLFSKRTNKSNQKSKNKKIPQWMIAFQNFLYPLLVLCSNPWYFLILVIFSKIIEIIIYIKHEDCSIIIKVLQINSFISQILYHLTFFIFLLCKDQMIIIYNSFVCISVFLLGAILNFISAMFIFICFFVKFGKAIKKSNKIAEEKLQSKLKYSFNNKTNASPITHQSPAQLTKKNIQNYQKTIKQKKNVRFNFWDQEKKSHKPFRFQLRLQQKTIKLDSYTWNRKL